MKKHTFYSYDRLRGKKDEVGELIRVDLENGETLEIRAGKNGIQITSLCLTGTAQMRIEPMVSNMIYVHA